MRTLRGMCERMKTRITKIYLVQIIDKDGDEVGCEYVAGDMSAAKAAAAHMKENIKEFRAGEQRRRNAAKKAQKAANAELKEHVKKYSNKGRIIL